MKRGSVARQEKRENIKTILLFDSPFFVKALTKVYAMPAPMPPINPIKEDNASAFWKLGLITNKAPINAKHIHIH